MAQIKVVPAPFPPPLGNGLLLLPLTGRYDVTADPPPALAQSWDTLNTTYLPTLVAWAIQAGELGTAYQFPDPNIDATNLGTGDAVHGTSVSGNGVHGSSEKTNGVLGECDNGTGVSGTSITGVGVSGNGVTGVSGTSPIGVGVSGNGVTGVSGKGTSASNDAIQGISNAAGHAAVAAHNYGGGFGLYGTSDRPGGTGIYAQGATHAAVFDGDVQVNGMLTATKDANVNGTLNVAVDIVLTGADFAEEFDLTGTADAEPGTVMVLDGEGGVEPSCCAYDRKVAGIISSWRGRLQARHHPRCNEPQIVRARRWR